MKNVYLLLFLCCCITTIQAQRVPVSLNGSYRTKAKDLGIGAQVMIPIYKSLYIAPTVNYFFEKEYRYEWPLVKGKVKTKTLNYGLDVHYAFHLKKSQSFLSPFIGIEGMTGWSTSSGQSLSIPNNSDGSNRPSKWENFGRNLNTFNSSGNIGIAGKWFLDERLFINTQVKYSIIFDYMDDNHFVFTTGIGYAF